MKVAAAQEFRPAASVRGQFQDPRVGQFLLIGVFSVGMWRRDQHGGAVLGSRMKHRQAVFAAGGPVIQTPDDMAMDVDHARRRQQIRWRGRGLCGLRLAQYPDVQLAALFPSDLQTA